MQVINYQQIIVSHDVTLVALVSMWHIVLAVLREGEFLNEQELEGIIQAQIIVNLFFMAVLFYFFLKRFGAQGPVDETMKIHKTQFFCVMRKHLLNEIVFVIHFSFTSQLLPKQFEISVRKTITDGLSFDLVEAYFATNKLYPALEFFLILRQLINILTTNLQLPDSLLTPVLFKITDKYVDHLQTTEVKLCSFVIEHMIKDDLTGLIEDHENVIETMVVLIQPFLFMQRIELLKSSLFHQKKNVIRTKFVVAFLFNRTAMLPSFNCVQTSRCFLSREQPILVIVLITEFSTTGC